MAGKITLLPGEQIAFELEADFWNIGNNPIQKALGKFVRLINKILGYRVKGYLTVTNMRVIETKEEVICYCIPSNRSTKVVLPQSVKEVGFIMERICGLFCPTYFFYYEGFTQSTLIQIEGGSDEQLTEYVQKFYEAIKK
jgi:hypothetical protein